MKEYIKNDSSELTGHFFRTEYGKMVSVITRYIGTENVETAEDIVQETLLKAVEHWQKGIPENPQAWLYKTAKNLTLNILKRKKYQKHYEAIEARNVKALENISFSEKLIMDEQLKMMFVCCHPSISENSQITLILKILCGFSISEIANSFFSTNETINKRLVRGRKQLRENKVNFEIPQKINENLNIVLKTIYLLFNEGYFPSQKNESIRYDLCLEAIRLAKILISSPSIQEKSDCHALLALMYLNASRFKARINEEGLTVEMEKQDRKKWNQELIQRGVQQLNLATEEEKNSTFLILATISAHHCIAHRFEQTNWTEILSLYDRLVELENSPLTRLNRSVALAKVKGNMAAIGELKELEAISDIGSHYLFHFTLGEFYHRENKRNKAIDQFTKALALAKNGRDIDLLKKKLRELVPNYQS
jgi:RNA polymerase sigma factor (sigma-70 family)